MAAPDTTLPVFPAAAFGLDPGDADVVEVNLRAEHIGVPSEAVVAIRAAVESGSLALVHDPLGEWPTFALGRIGGGIAVITMDGRANFASIEAALRYGLTTWPEPPRAERRRSASSLRRFLRRA